MSHTSPVPAGSFRNPFTGSLLVTPVALLMAFVSAGAGHGDYVLAMFLFPYSMLLSTFTQYLTTPLILLAIAQFPVYGIVLGLANRKGWIGLGVGVLIVAHMVAALAALSLRDRILDGPGQGDSGVQSSSGVHTTFASNDSVLRRSHPSRSPARDQRLRYSIATGQGKRCAPSSTSRHEKVTDQSA